MKPAHVVSLIESAYRVEQTTEEWLEGIAAASASAFNSNHGAMAFRYDASSGDWVSPSSIAVHGVAPEFLRDFFNQPDMPEEGVLGMTRVFQSVRAGTLRAYLQRLDIPSFTAILDRYQVADMIGLNGLDPSGRGCLVAATVPKGTSSTRVAHVWHRLAAHLSAGNRLRAILETLAREGHDPSARAEAVLTPKGKVEHATGPAEARSARDALRDALVRIDGARSERDDPRRCVDLWQGLVAGRWSLVEQFERDGKRYVLAHKNDPELAGDRALTLRERQVLGYAELGNTNKLTAYTLGLSTSTVSTVLARARRKIGMVK